MGAYFKLDRLSVGYNGNVLIRDIDLEIEKGSILTLIGPNGAGKSTILKTITGQLSEIYGRVLIGGRDIKQWSFRDMARQVAVVLTDRIRPELMTAREICAMGRYPYTNMLGRLTKKDREIIDDSLRRVHAGELAEQDFATLSDGQRQRIMLARAICQEPELIVLDEPTAYLDIRHKIEFLDILREMARDKQITVIMSLHEIDLASKISDYILCVKGERIAAIGRPEEILRGDSIEKLYDIEQGSYNMLFGSVELERPSGIPEIFVAAGGGYGIPVYRMLQKRGIPSATGILFQNDTDFQVAQELCAEVVSCPAFEEMGEREFEQAAESLISCRTVIDAGTPIGSLNRLNGKLLELAREKGINIIKFRDN
ncbi:MAG: ABC transporter ATP-binding protein [Candidatus Limivicinus sp.]|jgi:iron complex transport system ATP-binding protein